MTKIFERVAELKRGIERDRFAGNDPVVAITPDLDGAEIVARVLAAERAHDPVVQQRVSLLKALTRGLSALIYVPLDEKLRLGLADLDATLDTLDLLPDAERLHYRDELDRLLNLREAAASGDPFLDAAWTLTRAQLAMAAGQDEAALVWLLRLPSRHILEGGVRVGDGYLADLIARARQRLLIMLGIPGTTPEEGEKPPEAVRPRELFNALAARLAVDLGRDMVAGIRFFAINEYMSAEIAEEGTGRRKGTGRMGRKG
jgi:hypothetical protein